MNNQKQVLIDRRRSLLKEYGDIKHKLKIYQEKKEQVKNELSKVNKDLCSEQGHVVTDETLYLTKDYGFVFTCINCGEIIEEKKLGPKDKILIRNNNHKKIKYKTNK